MSGASDILRMWTEPEELAMRRFLALGVAVAVLAAGGCAAGSPNDDVQKAMEFLSTTKKADATIGDKQWNRAVVLEIEYERRRTAPDIWKAVVLPPDGKKKTLEWSFRAEILSVDAVRKLRLLVAPGDYIAMDEGYDYWVRSSQVRVLRKAAVSDNQVRSWEVLQPAGYLHVKVVLSFWHKTYARWCSRYSNEETGLKNYDVWW